MWPKAYRNYPKDTPLIQKTVEPNDGIIGCEMHDSNGWGEDYHRPQKRKHGVIFSFLKSLFGSNEKEGESS
ncbi:MAG: hypothetical protein AAGG81_04075 [Chlamydiota bacterium]